MKKINLFLLFAVISFLFAGCAKSSSSSKIMKENRQVGTFNKIEAENAIKVYFTQSDTLSIVVEADSSIINKVETVCKNEKLFIGVISKNISVRTSDVKVYVSAPSLSEIDLSGASVFSADSLQFSNSLKMDISGASAVMIKHIEACDLEAEVSGASTLKVGLDISGNLDVEVSGASNAKFSGSCNNLSTEASGASNIDIKNLKFKGITKSDVSGASSISK